MNPPLGEVASMPKKSASKRVASVAGTVLADGTQDAPSKTVAGSALGQFEKAKRRKKKSGK